MSLLQAILNARSTRLTSLPYTVGATVLSVEDASQFSENLTASVDFNAVIFDRSYGSAADALKAGRYEIVKVTGDAVNDLTVVRAQEGTTAVAFDTGGIWEMVLAPTKAMFDELVPRSDIVNNLVTGGVDKTLSAEQGKVLDGMLPIPIEGLVIGGGGSGGNPNSGGSSGAGGGAGGHLSFEGYVYLDKDYQLVVGGGGVAPTSFEDVGRKGTDSLFGNYIALGGGGGGGASSNESESQSEKSGGSGGGSGSYVGKGFPLQGFDGGLGGGLLASGGGGASAVGVDSSSTGNGGAGKSSSITGSAVTRAGGGGGGAYSDQASTVGGSGGGGRGAFGSNHNADAGTANTGGGGGGGARDTGGTLRAANNGGSGVVILRYSDTYSITVGAGLTSSTTTDGDFKVTTFTAGADLISFQIV